MAIEDYVPRTRVGLVGLGFLFGARTSSELGYPLVSGLNKQVAQSFRSKEKPDPEELAHSKAHALKTGMTSDIVKASSVDVKHYAIYHFGSDLKAASCVSMSGKG